MRWMRKAGIEKAFQEATYRLNRTPDFLKSPVDFTAYRYSGEERFGGTRSYIFSVVGKDDEPKIRLAVVRDGRKERVSFVIVKIPRLNGERRMSFRVPRSHPIYLD